MLVFATRPQQLAAKTNIAQTQPIKARVAAPNVRARSPLSVQAFGGLFGGGGAKIDDSKMYICVDCGYIYDGRDPFSAVPNSYNCPVCNSAKRRFKAYKGGDVRGRPRNDNKSMVARLKAKQW